MTLDLAGGDDFASGGSPNQGITFNGGDGNDTLISSSAVQNTLNGGDGRRHAPPRRGRTATSSNGGAGNDLIQFVQGATRSTATTDVDTLELSSSLAHSISLDGVANDGSGMNVFADVENVKGGDSPTR